MKTIQLQNTTTQCQVKEARMKRLYAVDFICIRFKTGKNQIEVNFGRKLVVI